jgi:alpha-beta hydrolase superfamily lysophospholipase
VPPAHWTPDTIIPRAESRRIDARDASGRAVTATLVRRRATVRAPAAPRAVLSLHGWIDYCFHAHVADAWAAAGWDFYALDLHACGRSLAPGDRPHYCTTFADYDAELQAALAIITGEDGHARFVLLGHSTGGLHAVTWAARTRPPALAAIVLNGPFLRLPVPAPVRAFAHVAAAVGRLAPTIGIGGTVAPHYVHSLHQRWRGEWDFDLARKPERGFPLYLGWLGAVLEAQAMVARGLALTCPVLLVRSDRSWRGRQWDDRYLTSDAVLRVADMHALVSRLGARVEECVIEHAMHDATLSAPAVRARAIGAMVSWADTVLPLS